jgi:hypothetical protein
MSIRSILQPEYLEVPRQYPNELLKCSQNTFEKYDVVNRTGYYSHMPNASDDQKRMKFNESHVRVNSYNNVHPYHQSPDLLQHRHGNSMDSSMNVSFPKTSQGHHQPANHVSHQEPVRLISSQQPAHQSYQCNSTIQSLMGDNIFSDNKGAFSPNSEVPLPKKQRGGKIDLRSPTLDRFELAKLNTIREKLDFLIELERIIPENIADLTENARNFVNLCLPIIHCFRRHHLGNRQLFEQTYSKGFAYTTFKRLHCNILKRGYIELGCEGIKRYNKRYSPVLQ